MINRILRTVIVVCFGIPIVMLISRLQYWDITSPDQPGLAPAATAGMLVALPLFFLMGSLAVSIWTSRKRRRTH